MRTTANLSPDHNQYRQWLKSAHDLAQRFNGSERMASALLNPLIKIDAHVRAVNGGRSSAEIEQKLADQVWPDARLRTVDEFLAAAGEVYDLKLKQATDLEATLHLLAKGGAVIRHTQIPFVQTDDGRLPPPGTSQSPYHIRTEPRLRYLLALLKEHAVYTDDIVAHIGPIDRGMMRRFPYLILQIPRLDKEIAVCDQVGETTLVAGKIIGPDVWTQLTKDQLKTRPEIQSVHYHNRQHWENKITALLFDPADIGTKIDISRFSARKPPFDLDLIKQSILAHRRATGTWPTANSGAVEYGPYDGRETWGAIDAALNGLRSPSGMLKQVRGLPGGSSLATLNAEVSAEHGLDYVNHKQMENLTFQNIKAGIFAHRAATGTWPTANSGAVEYGPYRGRETWGAIDARVERATNSEWDAKTSPWITRRLIPPGAQCRGLGRTWSRLCKSPQIGTTCDRGHQSEHPRPS